MHQRDRWMKSYRYNDVLDRDFAELVEDEIIEYIEHPLVLGRIAAGRALVRVQQFISHLPPARMSPSDSAQVWW